jgi:hypothetical protein
MFVLSEIVKEKLFALAEADGSDVFHRCFEDWQDVSYLYDFFKRHPKALAYFRLDVKTAVRQVLSESAQFSDDILNIAAGKSDATSLDDIVFQPLHSGDDFDLPIIETKAYGKEFGKSLLRLYAIRLNDGAYIVVGGVIKTARSLQECEGGEQIVTTLKELSKMLRKDQMYDAFDIGILLV